jgi:hypothetical protein
MCQRQIGSCISSLPPVEKPFIVPLNLGLMKIRLGSGSSSIEMLRSKILNQVQDMIQHDMSLHPS